MHIHEIMGKLAAVDADYRSKHGRPPSQPHLATAVGITVEKLQMLLKVHLESQLPELFFTVF